ncbi:MAG: SDR family oxidoreductase [Bacteroidetes bacterium]|nr:SDR family oxidoreductase [Bacteroidota bacterium]
MPTALITGASSGIGLEFAKIHAAKGGDLILVARSGDKLEQLKTDLINSHPIKVHIVVKDLGAPNAAQEVYDEVKKLNLQVDYLINNAGFGDFGLFLNTSWDKEQQMMQLNMIALSQLTKLFVKDMAARKSGKILNIASTASFQPGPTMAIYYATKAFVYYFSSALYNELKPYGISVTSFHPGPTKTGFQDAADMHSSRLLKLVPVPEALPVAKKGYAAMMKGKRTATPGLINNIFQISSKLTPWGIIIPVTRYLQGSEQVK